MKLAMMAYTDPSDSAWGKTQNIAKLCHEARAAGIDGIEWLTDNGVAPGEIRRIAGDYGLPAVCYTPFSVDMNFQTQREREPAMEVLKRELETAVILGADKIMLPIGGKPGITRDASRRNVIAGLATAVPIAQACGLILTIEHYGDMRAPFIVSADVNEAVREVPGLKVTYDSGNGWLGGEDAVAGYRNSQEHIVHVHFKDMAPAPDGTTGITAADGHSYVMVAIGTGLVDHVGVLQAMRQFGYDGYIDIELGGSRMAGDDAFRRSADYLREQMAKLESE